jgi:lysozyme family protein
MSFDSTMAHVFKWEGGYVNDEDDPGGETNYGISKRAHPDVDIANLTEDEAKEIYRREYWEPACCYALPERLAAFHMDFAVNAGVRRANKTLQEALRVHADGAIGPVTLSAIDHMDAFFNTEGVLYDYALRRIHHYTHLAHSDPVRKKYLTGWLRRTLDALGMAV